MIVTGSTLPAGILHVAKRKRNGHARSPAGRRFDAKFRAHRQRALAHRAHPPGCFAQRHCRIETRTVVRDHKPQLFGPGAKLHPDLRRPGMLDRIIEGFLRDPEQRGLDGDWEAARWIRPGHLYSYSRAGGYNRGVRLEGGEQTVIVERGWVQFRHDVAGIARRGFDQRLHAVKPGVHRR